MTWSQSTLIQLLTQLTDTIDTTGIDTTDTSVTDIDTTDTDTIDKTDIDATDIDMAAATNLLRRVALLKRQVERKQNQMNESSSEPLALVRPLSLACSSFFVASSMTPQYYPVFLYDN